MESIPKSEDIIKENGLLQDINNILTGHCFYGTCPIEEKLVKSDVLWIGVDGHTSSIGQWIRFIWDLIYPGNLDPHAVVQGFKWYTYVNANNPKQRQWRFGIKLTHRGNEQLIVCGGATDYSGEGEHGKLLADAFMDLVCSCPISILNSDHLKSLLAGGVDI